MIDNYLLEELVAVADAGTLGKAAKKIGLSQAALTRGTQKIEHELGVTLFIRKPNRLTLTKTGQYAVKQARKVLSTNQNFIANVKNYEQNLTQVSIASIAPGPLILLRQMKQKDLQIASSLLQSDKIAPALTSHRYSCVISDQKIHDDQIVSEYLGDEKLIVNLNQFSNLTSKKSVGFKELAGLSFVVLNDIGIWTNIIKKNIPNAKFLFQQSESNFNEIRNNSIFSYFTTNITQTLPNMHHMENSDRVPIKISDPDAKIAFYANYLQKNEERLQPAIQFLKESFQAIN